MQKKYYILKKNQLKEYQEILIFNLNKNIKKIKKRDNSLNDKDNLLQKCIYINKFQIIKRISQNSQISLIFI